MPVEGATTLMFDDGLLGRWVKDAKAGDRASFDALIRAHQDLVLRVAQRLLLNSAEAQDAAQEVFLRLHRSLDRIQEQRALEPWLYRTTVNICHDLRRKQKKLVSLELAGHVATREAGPVEALEVAERQAIFERALRSLGDRERTVIVLRDLEGLPTAEVAAILGTAESTVRTQIAAGRLKLTQWIDINYRSRR
jgi:RNA polymerase sigma-70 factor (ECF subfamily)